MNFDATVDITELGLATQVHTRVLAGHYAEQLEALQDAARGLGYYFAKAESGVEIPPVLGDILAEAIVLRKEASLVPDDEEGARRRAGQRIAEGFGALLRDEILNALGESGIYLQATNESALLVTSAKIMRDESLVQDSEGEHVRDWPLRALRADLAANDSEPHQARVALSVDVTKEEVVISGEGTLATYRWKPDHWGNGVKRLSIQAMQGRTGSVEHEVFSVVAGDGEDAGRKGGVIADDLSEKEAIALIKRIQEGVRVNLGITGPDNVVVELSGGDDDLASGGSRATKPLGFAGRVVSGVSKVLSVLAFIALGITALCVLAFGLPVAYKAGQHFASNVFRASEAANMQANPPYLSLPIQADALPAIPRAPARNSHTTAGKAMPPVDQGE